ncbi:MAG: alpha/beta hydrolase [Halocynthiibacter sp.]
MFWRVLILCLGVSACAAGYDLKPYDARIALDVQTVFVGTNRSMEDGDFGAGRSRVLSYETFDVSIPPNHQLGKLEDGENPDKRFTVKSRQTLKSARSFRSKLKAALAARTPREREVMVYVHGYNNSYADGIFRTAQLMHDFDIPAVGVHYSWPSAGDPLEYGYDRESVLFARDGLQTLLETIKASGAKRVLLVGHSMGAGLVVETLRQMDIKAPGASQKTVSGVVLLSPDVHPELFVTSVSHLSPLPEPFVIVTSQHDRALQLSALISNSKKRLGNLDNFDQLSHLKLQILDVSDFKDSGAGHHFVIGNSRSLISLLAVVEKGGGSIVKGAEEASRALKGTVVKVQSLTRFILTRTAGS